MPIFTIFRECHAEQHFVSVKSGKDQAYLVSTSMGHMSESTKAGSLDVRNRHHLPNDSLALLETIDPMGGMIGADPCALLKNFETT